MTAVPQPEQPAPYGPPPGWSGDWSALTPEAQTAVWQQYAIREDLERARLQRSTASTGTVAFWVVFALVGAAVLLVGALAVTRLF